MILVTTPTGDIGARVLGHLAEAGAPLRVIARHPSRILAALRNGLDVIEGSHADASVIATALFGVEAVFWLPPGSPSEPDAKAAYVGFSQPFCDALPSSGVSHVVTISALGRGWESPQGSSNQF